MNGTTRFLATVPHEQKGNTRNVCNEVGYESVALVPIPSENRILGLMHVADPREDRVPLKLVELLETVGMQLAVAIQRVRAEEQLRRAHDELEQRVRERTAELEAINEQLRAEVAERRQVEEALRRSEQRYRLLFDSAPVGIGITDFQGNALDCNRSMAEITGYRLEELKVIGVDAIYVDPEDRRSLLEALQRSNSVRDREVRLRRKDGTIYDALLNVDLVELGGHKRLFTIVRDITRMKETEEALRRAERLASVGTLAAGIAHEINNPLGAIVLSAETALASKGQPDREGLLDKSLGNIHDSAVRCGCIVKNVLRFARAETSEKSVGDLSEAIHRALELTKKLAADAKVAVRLELGDGRTNVLMNPTEMEQVFVNLVSNAVQASKPGTHVIVRTEPADDSVCALVEDRGCGMTQEQVLRIFDPFYTTRHREGGTGLGLSITYGIVQDHAGTIRAESTPGKGTTMRLTLPVSAHQPEETDAAEGSKR
jgi:PAS domain S-box-containing protein